jgi:hypothetical protein
MVSQIGTVKIKGGGNELRVNVASGLTYLRFEKSCSRYCATNCGQIFEVASVQPKSRKL